MERRGPSPLTIKAEPVLGPSLKKILHLHLLSRHENDFINILYYLCLKVIIHFLYTYFSRRQTFAGLWPKLRYSGDLNTVLVWYLNGQKQYDNQMICYSNGDLNIGLF